MAGRTYESVAQHYADIVAHCDGNCDWLKIALEKTVAEGLTNIAYGGLGVGSVLKPGQVANSGSNPTAGNVREQVVKNTSWDTISNVSKTAFNSAKNNIANWIPKDKNIISTSASRSAKFNTNDPAEIRTIVKDALNSPNTLFYPIINQVHFVLSSI